MYGGADEVAPAWMTPRVKIMIWEIRNHLGTECAPEAQGRTWPWDMEKAGAYLSTRSNSAPGVFVKTTQTGVPSDTLRDHADSIIRRGTPVIIGLGWEHYALAYGYRKKICDFGRDQHEFYINTGQGDARWTSAETWFVGSVSEYPPPAPPACPGDQKCCRFLDDGRCTKCVDPGAACPGNDYGGCPASRPQCCEPGEGKCRRCYPRGVDCP